MRPIDADALLIKSPFNKAGGKLNAYTDGYLDGVCDAREAIAKAPTIKQPKWIPVVERLPTEEGMYRVCHKSKVIADRYFYGDGELFTKFGNDPVTHWKPIEEPPKGDE